MPEEKITDKTAAAVFSPMTAPMRGCYCSRELSWLSFNERVLDEALDLSNPLLERLNFVSIFQHNLDEFYMVRVGMLMNRPENHIPDSMTGMTGSEELSAVLARTKKLLKKRDRIYADLMDELSACGIKLFRFSSLTKKELDDLKKYFLSDLLPMLSFRILKPGRPLPFLRSGEIYAVAALRSKGKNRIGIISCSGNALRRLTPVPGRALSFILTEELILGFLPAVFPDSQILSSALIRPIRSADIPPKKNDFKKDNLSPGQYRKAIQKMIRRRSLLGPVKLEYSGSLSREMRFRLCRSLRLSGRHLFSGSIPLDLSFTDQLREMLRDKHELFYPCRMPQNSPNVDLTQPMITQICRHDILLFHPYESIRPLLRLLREAGEDPEVISIRMTLYRAARNSKIVEALAAAAKNGKRVSVAVELRARFDEANNLAWSKLLERAGCQVTHGTGSLKTHAKLLLITRIHHRRLEYITQIGTGNYNEDTASFYTDLSLMTASPEIGADAARVFNRLTMNDWRPAKYLLTSPDRLLSQILRMIDDEIRRAKSGHPAYLGFKLNGLTDREVIDKLIEASASGVNIDLLVRGICCLTGGIPGLTDHIRVCSIVGRYLEHARIYLFGVEGRQKIYLSSADLMTRNTRHRVEVAVPVRDPKIRKQVSELFFAQLHDTAKLRVQRPDGTYARPTAGGIPFNSQDYFCDMARGGAWALPEPDAESAAQKG